MSISKRVKEKRMELALTQAELAKRVGITQQSLQKIEDGRTQNPRKLLSLAKQLRCDPEWLLSGHLDEVREERSRYNNQNSTNNMRPLLSQNTLFGRQDSTADTMLEAPHSASSKAFWFMVIGDSMSSISGLSIPENYLILIEPEASPKHGDLVLAKLNTSQEITFKQLVMDAGNRYLKPLNSNYLPVQLNSDMEIIGVAKEAKRHLC
ncbi:LexA family protein [Marinomonas posidonica]|uniref:Phage repressor like transcriptional regulator, XRE family n=1 Tax=Marinomonas posidonica (strain CECT 7376 / NCIMB 14433 / IVIA-Po-181) TaxID=491952 RepID=F6CYJ1_MARPP|nr:LexA family transcriptional regulator [Marinomonas posidonica]AEF54600.1 phage repressor like transcriptional regulator, XRE family [Marinomonas posidonica IVIA-Po-181]